MMIYNSFSAIRAAASTMPSASKEAEADARKHQDALTKPLGALGRLEELAIFLAGWQRCADPKLDKAQAIVFAGNHGICAQQVNPYPMEVTAQMVANFEAGGAAINQLCRLNGADLSVVALELDRPTQDFTQAPAMSEEETLAAFNRGAAAIDPTAQILLLGEMGIGNSTISAALAAKLFGGDVADWVGRGTGSDTAGMARKISAIERGLALHSTRDPLEILAALGGREQAAICGAIFAARQASIPVLLDGFICTAAAAPLYALDPSLLDHCLIGHLSAEPGHRRLLAALHREAILDFDMRLGEGTGAALALGILRGAVACHNGMASFDSAGISKG